MLSAFKNFFALASVAWPFLKVYQSQFRFRKGRGALYDFWVECQKEIPELKDLPGPLQRRIGHYLHANSVTAQWFSILHRHRMSRREKEAGWYLAIATPIADYLVDNEKLSLPEIQGLLDQSYDHTFGHIARKIYRQAKSLNAHPKLFDQYLHLTLDAQANSLQQESTMLAAEALKHITWQKGGYALLLYRTALQPVVTEDEKKGIFQLGGLMQLHNDIFDLHRDLSEKIHTIPSLCRDVAELQSSFQKEIQQTVHAFRQIGADRNSRHRFYLLLNLAVGTGHICLEQYLSLQRQYGYFEPTRFSREELICDMENLNKISKNLFQTLRINYDQI